MGFQRNIQAENSQFVLIPKDSVLAVGIENVDPHINIMNVGDFKGHNADKYKMTLRVLEAGTYYNTTVKASVTAAIERIRNGSEIQTVAYGNSRKYCELMKSLDSKVTDDNMPSPESDDKIDEFAQQKMVGKVFLCTFSTYNFKNSDGEKITINTIKKCEPVSDEMRAALATNLEVWEAEVMSKRVGGAADSFDPEDFD